MWWKNIRKRKLQTAIMFLIVMLCSTLLMASFGITTSLEEPFDELIEECNMPEIKLYPYSRNIDEVLQVANRFKTLDEVSHVEIMKRYYIEEEFYHEQEQVDVFIDFLEYKEGVFDNIHFFEGNIDDLRTMHDDECALPACVSNEYGIQVGDKIKIRLSSMERTFTVKAIFSSPYDCMTAFNSSMIINHIPEDLNQNYLIYIYAKDGVHASQIESAYRRINDGMLEGVPGSIPSMKDSFQLVGGIAGSIFLVIGVIMLLISCLIINFMIRSMMVSDAKTIAVYKTMGYESKDILFMYLKFYAVIVSIACILGIGLGVIIRNFVLEGMYSNIGKSSSQSLFVIGLPCFVGIVGFVMSVIYLIIRKTRNIKPVLALNGMTNRNTKKSKYHGNSKLQFSPFGIAMRNIRCDKKGMIGILIISFMTVFIVNFAMISLDVANSLKEDNDYWIGVDKCDVMITLTKPENFVKIKNIIEKEESINYYLNSITGYTFSLDWEEGVTSTYMYGFVYDDFTNLRLPVMQGRNPESAKEIALTTVMAEQYHKTVGDYITVMKGQERIDLLITGIFQTYYNMGHSARVTSDVLRNMNLTVDYNTISIYLKDGIDINDYVTNLQEKVASLGKVIPRTEAMLSIMNMIQRPQKLAIPYLLALVLLIGGVNIFSVVILRNAKNEKMNGIYKSIGYTSGHLIGANVIYISMLAAASMVVAIPVILYAYPKMIKVALTMFHFIEYPVHYNALHLVIINTVIFFIFVLFTLGSSLSVKKVSVRDLVNE